ncbi:MAG: Sec-independent protein translocase subunit TatA/TatB [Bacteroidota bacterium]
MNTIPLFISGAEIAVILLIIVMVFGADKIPDIARTIGQTVKSVRNATDEIKYEITKTTDEHTKDFKNVDLSKEIKKESEKIKEDIEEITGPVKRRF